MVTDKPIVALATIVLLLVSALSFSAEPIASIDRSRISVDDTLTLTIRMSGTNLFSSPDTAPLQRDFEVLSTRQNSRHSIINGKSESSTEWQISLLPRSTGTLRIPPLTVGDSETEPLTVEVEESRHYDAASGDPVFLESEVSADSVYVQQQLLFTVRVFVSIQLDNLSLSDIDIDDTLIEKLSQNSFQRRINNRLYRIHEIRYALFPQKSGTLTIPEVIFRANKVVNQRSIFSLPGQGQPIRQMTRQHEVRVLNPPQQFTRLANATWLPAKNIQLVEKWSVDPDNIRVGDSITRTLTLKARGLLGSQLPPHEFVEIDGARLYPDQGKLENTLAEQGASSMRIDSTAIIPTREGKLEFPSITVHWWDTEQNTLRTTTLEAHTFDVKPALASSTGGGQPLAVDHSHDTPAPVTTTAAPAPGPGIWPWLAALLGALWLATLCLWWRERQSTTTQRAITPSTGLQADEKRLFKELLSLCRTEDYGVIRQALINWGQTVWPNSPIHSLGDIAHHAALPALTDHLRRLDNRLYGRTGDTSPPDTNALITLLTSVRDRQQQREKQRPADRLPGLYPGESIPR